MSGSESLAPLIDGVTACDLADTPVTRMTTKMLTDVGVRVASLDEADLVLAAGPREGGRADSIWVAVTSFGLA